MTSAPSASVIVRCLPKMRFTTITPERGRVNSTVCPAVRRTCTLANLRTEPSRPPPGMSGFAAEPPSRHVTQHPSIISAIPTHPYSVRQVTSIYPLLKYLHELTQPWLTRQSPSGRVALMPHTAKDAVRRCGPADGLAQRRMSIRLFGLSKPARSRGAS